MSLICKLQGKSERRRSCKDHRTAAVVIPNYREKRSRLVFLLTFAAALFCLLPIPCLTFASDSFRAPFRMFDVWTHGNVVAGDFNEDGCMDVAVNNGGSSVVAVLFGSCTGSLSTTAWYFPVGTDPEDVAAADFDVDGHLDLATANANGMSVSVLRGRGNGTFDPAVTIGLTKKAWYVTAGDLNGDGHPDLAVGCDRLVATLVNQGNGTFVAPWTIPTRGDKHLAIGDLTGDGLADVAVPRTLSDSVWVYPGTGTGALDSPIGVATGHYPTAPAVSDVNRDGLPDLVVMGSSTAVHLGQAGGTLAPPILSSTGQPRNGIVTDLNGDLNPDLAMAMWNYPVGVISGISGYLGVSLGNGDGTFSPTATTICGEGATGIALNDFDGDGHVDAAMVNGGWEGVALLRGHGDGTFGTSGLHLATPSDPRLISANDLNNDGKLDLTVLCTSECDAFLQHYGAIFTTLGVGDGTFAAPVIETVYRGDFCTLGMVVADFNEDGKPDLLYSNYSTTSVYLRPGNGDGTFGAESGIEAGASIDAVAAGLLDGDNHLDVVAADFDEGSSQIRILKGAGNGTFTSIATYPFGGMGSAIAIGRINGDLVPDISVLSQTNTATVLIGNGNGTFVQSASLATADSPKGVSLADMNADGYADLVIANSGAGSIYVYPGNGNGTFGALTTISTAAGNSALTTLDVNRDGALDIVSGSTGVSVYPGNNTLTFGKDGTYGAGSYPIAIASGDFNNDGAMDLATADEGSKTVTVLINTAPAVSGVPGEPGHLPPARLLGATPSPGRGNVRLDYRLPAPAEVRIDILDVTGRRVATITPGLRPAGDGSVVWNGRSSAGALCPAGIYLAVMSAGGDKSSTKIMRVGH